MRVFCETSIHHPYHIRIAKIFEFLACENTTAKRHFDLVNLLQVCALCDFGGQFTFNVLHFPSTHTHCECVFEFACGRLNGCLSILLFHCHLSFCHVNRSYNYLDDK